MASDYVCPICCQPEGALDVVHRAAERITAPSALNHAVADRAAQLLMPTTIGDTAMFLDIDMHKSARVVNSLRRGRHRLMNRSLCNSSRQLHFLATFWQHLKRISRHRGVPNVI